MSSTEPWNPMTELYRRCVRRFVNSFKLELECNSMLLTVSRMVLVFEELRDVIYWLRFTEASNLGFLQGVGCAEGAENWKHRKTLTGSVYHPYDTPCFGLLAPGTGVVSIDIDKGFSITPTPLTPHFKKSQIRGSNKITPNPRSTTCMASYRRAVQEATSATSHHST